VNAVAAGMAFALGKPALYFGKRDDFPFLMKKANESVQHVRIYDAANIDDVIAKLKNNKRRLFEFDDATG
jgi:hypothetical protein